MPELSFEENGAPADSTQPGTFGGGALPTDGAIASAGVSLSLVPAGLDAIAIFPPFAT